MTADSLDVKTCDIVVKNQNDTRIGCLLFKLPRDLYNEICSNWLDYESIKLLDVVVSQRDARPLWLEQLLSKSMISFHNSCEMKSWYNNVSHAVRRIFMRWLCVRNVKLSRLNLEDSDLDGNGNLIVNILLDQLDSLFLHDNSIDATPIINNCSNLSVLSLTRKINYDVSNISSNILYNLKKLFCYKYCPSSLYAIALYCRNLVVLKLCVKSTDVEVVKDIVKNNPQLKEVEVDDLHVIESMINYNLPNLEKIKVATTKGVSIQSVESLILRNLFYLCNLGSICFLGHFLISYTKNSYLRLSGNCEIFGDKICEYLSNSLIDVEVSQVTISMKALNSLFTSQTITSLFLNIVEKYDIMTIIDSDAFITQSLEDLNCYLTGYSY